MDNDNKTKEENNDDSFEEQEERGPIPHFPTSISIATPPIKTTYLPGDYFDPSGMTIRIYYSNHTSRTTSIFSYSPDTPLTTSDTYITVDYNNLFTANQAITVNNPPTSGYYPTQNIANANLGDNPFFNLFDQSFRFISETISVSREAYELSFNLIYYSRMPDRLFTLINCLPRRFKTNYHQYLIKDGKDSNNNDIYKYIDGEGYIHAFYQTVDDLYYCYESNLYLTFYEQNSVSYSKIVDESKNSLHFNNDGYLIMIVKEPINSDPSIPKNTIHINYSNGLISNIYNELDDDTEIVFNYDNQNRLSTIDFVYHSETVKTLNFTYSGFFIGNIDETANNQTRNLYYFSYDADSNGKFKRLTYIKNFLTRSAYQLSYEFDQNFNDYVAKRLRVGSFNAQNSLIEKETIEKTSYTLRNDGSNTISEIIIKNQNNLYFLYSLDKNAQITASFESDSNGEVLKTLYKESGIYLPINGVSNVSINTHQFKNVLSNLSITLSSDALSFFNGYKHFVLKMYVKINSYSPHRIKAILTSDCLTSSFINLNIDHYSGYQLIEIPFTRTIDDVSSATFYLSFKDENNSYVNVDIVDLYLVNKDKVTLRFLNGSYSFDDVTNIKIYEHENDTSPTNDISVNGNNVFFIDDFINTLKHHHNYFQQLYDETNPLYFNHGKTLSYYGFKFVLTVGSTQVFDSSSYNNSNLEGNDAWFIETLSFDNSKVTKTYLRFNNNPSNNYAYELVTLYYLIANNELIKDERKRYDFYNRLVSIYQSHEEDNIFYQSTTSYEYFTNGDLKKVSMSSGSETIILYEATQNSSGFINKKTSDRNSIDIEYNTYLESIITHNEVDGANSIFKKLLSFDAFKENLNSVSYYRANTSKGVNTQETDYLNQEVSFSLNNSSLYKVSKNDTNDTLTLKRYDGATYEDVISYKETLSLQEVTFIDSSNLVIKREKDIYDKTINEKLNNVEKVSFNYDTNGIESLMVLKNLTSIVDSYINKTTQFFFNGFNYYERSMFNNYFGIERLYNGFTLYSFDTEAYLIKQIGYSLEIFDSYQDRLQSASLTYSYDSFGRLSKKERFVDDNNVTCFSKDTITYLTDSFSPSTFKHTNLSIPQI